MNEINFTFFDNYFKIIEEFTNEEDKKEFALAIINFVYKDEKPQFTGEKKFAWLGIESSLETSKIRAFNKLNKTKTNEKQNKNKLKSKSNQNQIKIKTKQKQTSSISISYSISNNILEKIGYGEEKPFMNELDSLFNEYIELRQKEKMIVSDTVLNRLWNKLKPYDDETKKEMLGNAINGKWKDLYPIYCTKKMEILPDWFNKDIQDEMLTEEELKEFEGQLKGKK